jgi:hypothetical protein
MRSKMLARIRQDVEGELRLTEAQIAEHPVGSHERRSWEKQRTRTMQALLRLQLRFWERDE